MVYNLISSNKKINIGLQLLRNLLSFWIVLFHSYDYKNNKKLYIFFTQKKFHVPSFLLISFYFYYNCLSKRDKTKIIQRFKRLIIPYTIWPFIFLIINNYSIKLFRISIFNRYLSLNDYFYQILISNIYYIPFWYLNVSLFLSLIFAIICYLCKNHYIFIIQLLALLTYISHYSGIYNIFKKYKLFCMCTVLTVRSIPVSAIGLTFSSINLIDYAKKLYIRVSISSLLFLICLFKYNIFENRSFGWYYAIELNMLGAICFFILFSSIPFEKIFNIKINSFIKLISNSTGGVYYIHPFVKNCLKNFVIYIKHNTFRGSIIIFLVCNFFCIIGNNIFKNNSFKYLFM